MFNTKLKDVIKELQKLQKRFPDAAIVISVRGKRNTDAFKIDRVRPLNMGGEIMITVERDI